MALPDQWRSDGWQKESGQTWVHRVRHRDGRSTELFALKVLKNRDRRARFAREVRTMERLAEEHGASVPQLIDHDLDAGRPWFAMPWYPHGSLQDLVEATARPSIESVLTRLRGLCSVLDVVHRAGVAHRDLKPANVLIATTDALLLADFGLCLDRRDHGRHTSTREAIGSRWYIAPENENGINEAVDQRPADFYAFGKLAWALAVGRDPLARESITESRNRISELLDRPELRALDELVADLLIVDPHDRLSDWGVAEAELKSVEMHLQPSSASAAVEPPGISELARSISQSSAVLEHEERKASEQHHRSWMLQLRKTLRERSRLIEIPLGDFNRELQGALVASATTGDRPTNPIVQQLLPDLPQGDQRADDTDSVATVWIVHSSLGIPDFPTLTVRAWPIVNQSKIWLAHASTVSEGGAPRAASFLPTPMAKGCIGPFPTGRQATVDDLGNRVDNLAKHFITLVCEYLSILNEGANPADPDAWRGRRLDV